MGFWEHVNKQGPILVEGLGPCWEWTASLRDDGYGQYWKDGANWRAPRYSWMELVGPIPLGMEVCHRCDNPKCVRVSHLFLGTHKQNFTDAAMKGRIARGEKQHMAKLTADNVRVIRQIDFNQHTSDEVAVVYGVTRQTINKVRFNITWRWLS